MRQINYSLRNNPFIQKTVREVVERIKPEFEKEKKDAKAK